MDKKLKGKLKVMCRQAWHQKKPSFKHLEMWLEDQEQYHQKKKRFKQELKENKP